MSTPETGGEPRVRFLIAGAQKSGTSALFDYLREVPDLQLPAVKEAHFFDDEERVDWANPDYAPYHALFEADGRLCGEATPIYLYWPNALARIRAYAPDMRIVLILRDPIGRAFSHWQMEYARGKETEPFAWCIGEGRARMADSRPYPGFDRVFSYVERGFYGAQFAAALALFPREQFLLLRQDDLRADPTATVGRICGFLGVPPPAAPLAPREVRVAKPIRYPSVLSEEDRTLLGALYAPDLDRLAALGGPRF